jgi:hypothetical protein
MPAALLNTNAVSDLMRDQPQLKARVAKHADPILTSVVVVGEIRYGLSRLPAGKKRNGLEVRAHSILATIRIEPVTEAIAGCHAFAAPRRRVLSPTTCWPRKHESQLDQKGGPRMWFLKGRPSRHGMREHGAEATMLSRPISRG